MRLDFWKVTMQTGSKFAVGVGGVQWIQGNEAGIRVCDGYDRVFFHPWHKVDYALELQE